MQNPDLTNAQKKKNIHYARVGKASYTVCRFIITNQIRETIKKIIILQKDLKPNNETKQ